MLVDGCLYGGLRLTVDGMKAKSGVRLNISDNEHKPILEYLLVELGDADCDGAVKATDARLALRTAAGLHSLEAMGQAAADIDFDGKVKASDARGILRAAARLTQLKITK